MIRFLLTNIRWLAAGFLLTFASVFGQTWFIALSADFIKKEYALSDGRWGGLYTLATLSSAALMFWQGSIVDRVRPRYVAIVTTCVFAFAAGWLAISTTVWELVLAIFLLRFCGQGMFGHIAMTAIGRWFIAHRGRAVAVANLGYPASEIFLAAPAILCLQSFGWRSLWIIGALCLCIGIGPCLLWLLGGKRTPRELSESDGHSGLYGRHWQRGDAIRHWLLPALLPTLLTPGFMGTVLFFNQTHISAIKQWSLVAMAPGISCFAIAGVVASFISGWAVDRFGGHRLLPLLLVPIGIGILLVGLTTHIGVWYVALGLMGVTMGISGALWGSLLPFVYGTEHLGAIRSLTTTVMVVSTAIGPGLTGFLLDNGISFPIQCYACCSWCLVISCGSIFIEHKLSRELS